MPPDSPLGLDRNLEEEEEELRLSAQARVADTSNNNVANTKNVIDIFGQRHPAIASEIFDCMNCGRPIVAGPICSSFGEVHGKGSQSTTKGHEEHHHGTEHEFFWWTNISLCSIL
ncbi:hypothetical protein HPP92_013780 [Vanilla planifolia]|uniref:Uncharacterized protein n=1 Tax=Vanilla planifolia TaxID=51239 RepID=A0A835QVI5_VANPL|nr:hypothetical protein HPP92_013780 [Vanilla planifolia]